MTDLVLASQSPRRKELLARLGVTFRVQVADVDETPLTGETPDSMTVRLATLKARTVLERTDGTLPVLGGDTTVTLDDAILGKPADRNDAARMLRLLSGVTHVVHSAVALAKGGEMFHRLSSTRVTFDRLSEADIDAYCDSGEPFDKAGAYGIQGRAGQFVTRIEGSYSGVIGLPLYETRQLLHMLERS